MISDYETIRRIVGNVLDAPGKGGNISVKDGNKMIIKSSGEDLKQINHKVSTMLNGISIDHKPSMEYKFHQELNSKYVVHYHPVYVLPYLCSDYNFEFGETIQYSTPGNDLSDLIKKSSNKILFLKNHGVVIHSDNLEEIKILYDKIKNEFFEIDDSIFTPDDCVDTNSYELWLFRKYVKYVALKENLKLNELSELDINILNNDENEKFRKVKM